MENRKGTWGFKPFKPPTTLDFDVIFWSFYD
jgi:hypothetical protein